MLTLNELTKYSVKELRELNSNVVEAIKLRMLIEGKENAKNLAEGMKVKYTGQKSKISSHTFKIIKINKVNAVCKSLTTGDMYNIRLINIQPI